MAHSKLRPTGNPVLRLPAWVMAPPAARSLGNLQRQLRGGVQVLPRQAPQHIVSRSRQKRPSEHRRKPRTLSLHWTPWKSLPGLPKKWQCPRHHRVCKVSSCGKPVPESLAWEAGGAVQIKIQRRLIPEARQRLLLPLLLPSNIKTSLSKACHLQDLAKHRRLVASHRQQVEASHRQQAALRHQQA